MARGSHVRCRVCGVASVHATARFGLCPKHERQRNAQIKRDRQQAKARRRHREQLRQAVSMTEQPTAEEVEITPVPRSVSRPPRDRLAGMTDERKLVIATHYANYDIPVEEIVHHYHIANGDVTRIADELGVERRDRRNVGRRLPPGRFVDDVWTVDAEPEPVAVESAAPHIEPDVIPQDTTVALERMLRLPSTPEPVLRPRTSQPAPLHVTGHYVAQVVGEVDIEAGSMIEALTELAKLYPQLKVQQIRELWPGLSS